MGRLSIDGRAEREVAYNAMEVEITFYSSAESTTEALEQVHLESEAMLERLAEIGVETKRIMLKDVSLEKGFSEDGKQADASRSICWKSAFDMKFINTLMALVQEEDCDADVDYTYYLNNKREVHAELLREALADSKQKAEFLAESMGQRIVGIDCVTYSKGVSADWEYCEHEVEWGKKRRNLLSDLLQAPTTRESEEIHVDWLIE